VQGSTIAREADYCYPTKAGPEIGVASTKGFVSQLVILSALALSLAQRRGRRELAWDGFKALARLPQDLSVVLESAKTYQQFGADLINKKTILFVGRGSMFPIALEGALKTKEISYKHAEGYAAGELKHGPIALVDADLVAVVLAPRDELLRKTMSNLEEIRSRKGFIVGVGEAGCDEFKSLCDHFVPMPKVSSFVAPIVYVLPLQLISYGLAEALGRNIDKPRNLAKSVTVE
jgi:glucosamine--fructose-6-phosphate aminotransferase (isomerizing)